LALSFPTENLSTMCNAISRSVLHASVMVCWCGLAVKQLCCGLAFSLLLYGGESGCLGAVVQGSVTAGAKRRVLGTEGTSLAEDAFNYSQSFSVFGNIPLMLS
jgi:hypothetical protein